MKLFLSKVSTKSRELQKMQNIFNLIIYLLLFSIILLIIGLFILREFFKVEKVARPFLRGLFIYFFIMTLVNIIQIVAYAVEGNPNHIAGIYNNYFAVCLIYLAPLPLIYQIERTFFPERKVLAKYHLISLIILLLSIIFLALTIPKAIVNADFLKNFQMADYAVITYSNWGIIVIFICGAFLYLGLKSSGLYRRYSLIIFFGWGLNQIINGIGQILPYYTLLNLLILIFIIKIIAAAAAAYGFMKLYTLKSS